MTHEESFGHWLSGFADGESAFVLRIIKWEQSFRYRAEFEIKLRADDKRTLEKIKEFWGCGRLYYNANRDSFIKSGRRSCPTYTFRVARMSDIDRVLIPHFETHPLRSKKQRDFEIWKKGIKIKLSITNRRRWPKEDHNAFADLCNQITNVRRYNHDEE